MMIIEMPRGGKRPGAGRKPKPKSEKMSEAYLLRATDAQFKAWARAAKARELTLSDWARKTLDAAAR